MNINAVTLFSSPLITLEVEENTDKLIEYSYEFIKTGSHHKTYSTKDNRILRKFPKIEKILLNYFNKIATEVFQYTETFQITTSWITKIVGDYSEFHNHKNSFFSGVYYFGEYSEDSGVLQFQSPLMNHSDFHLIPKDWNVMNAKGWNITPEKNMLVIFPSYLMHRIAANKGTRYSLAFNIVPTGLYGYGDSTYNTEWFWDE